MKITSKKLFSTVSILLLISGLVFGSYKAYHKYMAPTDILFLNFSQFQHGNFSKADNSKFVNLHFIEIKEEDAPPTLSVYDVIYVFPYSTNVTEALVNELNKAKKHGTKVYVPSAQRAELDFSNLNDDESHFVAQCFDFGGHQNYVQLLNYSRKVLDSKPFFSDNVKDPLKYPQNSFFHLGENEYFETFEEYQKFYEESGKYKPGAPKFCLFTTVFSPKKYGMGHIDQIIKGLEDRGINVYPLDGRGEEIQALEKIKPDIALYIPMGRLASERSAQLVEHCKKANVLMLVGVLIDQTYEDWVGEQLGIHGGRLSVQVVLPELDGAVQPFPIAALYMNEHGTKEYQGIPHRVERLCNRIHNWTKLKYMDNKDKKIAIYYYKEPGFGAMVAGEMEVSPSILNFLKHLQKSGYTTGPLPEANDEFYEMIQTKGPVLGTYAKGTLDKLVANGDPALIPATTYKQWFDDTLLDGLYEQVTAQYGEAPGEHMTTRKDETDYLIVPHLKFGNIVILPQPAAAYGGNESKLVHGVKRVPPHSYIGSYLWVKLGFKADALMHFGTHGNLEFTPWKQNGLSGYDWPDALTFDLPHVYIYLIQNIGEAVHAKRRAYAVLISHLTPPYMETGVYGKFSKLGEKLHAYSSLEDDEQALLQEYRNSLKRIIMEMKLDVDLSIKDLADRDLKADEIRKVHHYVDAVETEKVTSGYYVLGRQYTEEQAINTARLMAIEPISYSLARLDISKGIAEESVLEEPHEFQYYRDIAFSIIDDVLLQDGDPLKFLSEDDINRAEKWASDNKRITMDELMSGTRSRRGNRRGSPGKIGGKSPGESNELTNLVIKIAADPTKKEMILSYQNTSSFERASKLLDESSRKKAQRMARFIPSMKEKLDITLEDDMMTLLGLMQKKETKQNVFTLIADPNLKQRIDQEKEKRESMIAADLLQDEKVKMIMLAMKPDGLKNAIKSWNKQALQKFKEDIQQFINNKNLADRIANHQSKNAVAITAILKSQKSIDLLQESIRTAGKQMKRLNDSEREFARSVNTLKEALLFIKDSHKGLLDSTELEMSSAVRALAAGYIEPSVAGDAIHTPKAVPTGRNLYAIDAEITPTEESWNVGKKLAQAIIDNKIAATGVYPKKIAMTFWGSEFIKSFGSTFAQALYFLGVEPVWNSLGRVEDVRLIPMTKLKRPRIDVVAQTSGQFRDIAASRIFLLNKAVRLAAEADDAGDYKNYVKEGTVVAEEVMKKNGLSPEQARRYATARVFGQLNGNYGTGIMDLIEDSDAWETEQEIVDRYMNNMGAVYTEDDWGNFFPGMLEAALQNADTVIHPRASRTWGPLELDHLYEYFGSLNAIVKATTGKDPDAYFSDLRNKSNPVVQGLQESIWVEARSTIFNPQYITDMQKEGTSAAEEFAETFRNTFGWNTVKPSVIDQAMWDKLYDVYINDSYQLDVDKFFEDKNPYALQEMTAVMLESVRKGYWEPGEDVIKNLANKHAKWVENHNAGCTRFICDNAKLMKLIQDNLDSEELKQAYAQKLDDARTGDVSKQIEGIKLTKEEQKSKNVKALITAPKSVMGFLAIISATALVFSLGIIRRRRNGN